MSLFSSRTAAIACGVVMLAATQAGSARADTITFEDLTVGAVLGSQYSSMGVTFTPNAFSGTGSSSSGENWATNTNMIIVSSTGADVGGLGTPTLVSGNILRSFNGWLNEDGDPSFRITFASPVSGFSATFAGVSTPADVRIFAYNGANLVGTVAGTTAGQFVLSYAGTVTSVAVAPGSFNDWVGVDNITFTPAVPPALQNAASRKDHGANPFDLILVPGP